MLDDLTQDRSLAHADLVLDWVKHATAGLSIGPQYHIDLLPSGLRVASTVSAIDQEMNTQVLQRMEAVGTPQQRFALQALCNLGMLRIWAVQNGCVLLARPTDQVPYQVVQVRQQGDLSDILVDVPWQARVRSILQAEAARLEPGASSTVLFAEECMSAHQRLDLLARVPASEEMREYFSGYVPLYLRRIGDVSVLMSHARVVLTMTSRA